MHAERTAEGRRRSPRPAGERGDGVRERIWRPTLAPERSAGEGLLRYKGILTCTPWHRPPGQVCMQVQVSLRSE